MERLDVLMIVWESRTVGEHRDLRLIFFIRVDLIAAFATGEMVGARDVFEPQA